MPSQCKLMNVDTGLCTICNTNYYLNAQGVCTLANPLIANCTTLASATTCALCDPTYALAQDAKSCRADVGSLGNCWEATMPTSPVCTICKAGYQFKSGSCAKNTNATIDDGCFDEASDKSCEFCISGYSMGTDGKCTNNNPQTTPSSQFLAKVSFLIALLLF